jgi:histidine kinase
MIMTRLIGKLRNSLASKLILTVGIVLLFTIATWAFFNIRHQKEKMMKNMVAGTDRLTTTIRLGTHYAMMLNARDEINQIINNIGRQPEIENIRIYNKLGEIKYSNNPDEVEQATNIKGRSLPHLPSKRSARVVGAPGRKNPHFPIRKGLSADRHHQSHLQ